jgi:16S rRNA (cytosine967-C5)-methyltransferase
LELCAAPGGKTAQLLTKKAKVTCLDVSSNRLKILQENMNRLKLTPEKIICANGIDFLKNTDEKFEIIVLDAPCSATGTLRRHPEVVHVKRKNDVSDQAKIQKDFLSKVDRALLGGGLLLYCTCSLCKEEGEHQIEEFLHANKNYKIINLKDRISTKYEKLITKEGFLRVLPHYMDDFGGADGFFAACLRKEC